MKTIVAGIISILLLLTGINAYAQGDLVVNGNLGVGTSTFTSKITTEATNESVMELTTTKNSSTFLRPAFLLNINGEDTNASASGFVMNSRAKNAASTAGNVYGGQFNSLMQGAGTVTNVLGLKNTIIFGTAAGTYNVNSGATGNYVELYLGTANTQAHTITNYYAYKSGGLVIGSGSLSGTNWYHGYFQDWPNYGGTVSNVAGLWIDRQTRGTNNYGIVLNGDGAGADIVFGPTQSERIYSNLGRLYAQDSFGNQTILSPHDPETGEWIYYSRNIKTGVVKRVDMEKLVKAVEKLTGETFMVESLIETN